MSSTSRKGLMVVDSNGQRTRFLRGIVTHDLMQHGVRFDDAYAVARAVRDRLSQRETVETSELRDLIREQAERQLGEQAADLRFGEERPRAERYVLDGDERVPFSRGVLAASIGAVGLDLDRSYRVIGELEERLREEEVVELTSREVAHRVGEILERLESTETARRYRLLRRLRRLPRPLAIYIGGASGTGKSTLALELAPILRIYRLNATDTIRQVMRMVFSPEILPALHTSSFELTSEAGRLSEPDAEERLEDRLLASFEEQCTRVRVGIRAVVERSIAENISIIVEGVHLYPPHIPFADLEGAAYQVPMILSLPDPEIHRSRFLSRSRRGLRRAERYMEHFPAIRLQHDFLLQQADAHDVAFLDTSFEAPPVPLALQLITSLLEEHLPAPAPAAREAPVPVLLLILDGLADRPARTLGGRTPLAAAKTPHLDRLAAEGSCGQADPIAPGVVPDTAAGSLALFTQSPAAMRRGPIEALGTGLKLRPGDLALRGNFACVDRDGVVVDRRAGRIRERTAELAQALDHLKFDETTVRVRQATEHRLAVVLRGADLSAEIVGSDPGDGAPSGPPLTPQAKNAANQAAVRTAQILARFEKKARKILADHPVNKERRRAGLHEANAVLTRGAGRVHRLPPIEDAGTPLRLACVAGDQTLLGLAEWLGAETIREDSMTANLDTNLRRKLECAAEALERKDLVVVHFKGADIAAHDQRPDLKAEFLERVDQELGRFLKNFKGPLRIAIASDHATLSESGQHAADPLPIILWGDGIEADDVRRFDEQAAAAGSLRRFPLRMLLGRLFQID